MVIGVGFMLSTTLTSEIFLSVKHFGLTSTSIGDFGEKSLVGDLFKIESCLYYWGGPLYFQNLGIKRVFLL